MLQYTTTPSMAIALATAAPTTTLLTTIARPATPSARNASDPRTNNVSPAPQVPSSSIPLTVSRTAVTRSSSVMEPMVSSWTMRQSLAWRLTSACALSATPIALSASAHKMATVLRAKTASSCRVHLALTTALWVNTLTWLSRSAPIAISLATLAKGHFLRNVLSVTKRMREEQASSNTSNQAQEVLASYSATRATILIPTVSASLAMLPAKPAPYPRTPPAVLATLATTSSGSASPASTAASQVSMVTVQRTCVFCVTIHARLVVVQVLTCVRSVLLGTYEGRACV